MRRLLAVVATMLCFVAHLSAQQINIELQNRVANVGNGYCGHCCIETVARHFNYPQAFNRVATLHARWGDYGGGLYDSQIYQALQEYHIPFYAQLHGSYRYDWLQWACVNGYPCILHWKPAPGTDVGHYVILVGFYDDAVGVIDSNAIRRITWLTRSEFAAVWSGGFILVCPASVVMPPGIDTAPIERSTTINTYSAWLVAWSLLVFGGVVLRIRAIAATRH